jgi:hypothetical protein
MRLELTARRGSRRVGSISTQTRKDENRWSVISFFDSEEAAAAAEERFEQMGDAIPESVRGKRISLESFEVAFDVEMVR